MATSLRRTIAGQAGSWFYVTSGTWKGYWLRESGAVSLPGGSAAAAPGDQVFSPPARVGVKKGTHTGYAFGPSGGMTGTRTSTGVYREGNAAELRALPGPDRPLVPHDQRNVEGLLAARLQRRSRSFPAADARRGIAVGTALGTASGLAPTGPSVPWLGGVLVGRVRTDAVMRDRIIATDPSEVTRPR